MTDQRPTDRPPPSCCAQANWPTPRGRAGGGAQGAHRPQCPRAAGGDAGVRRQSGAGRRAAGRRRRRSIRRPRSWSREFRQLIRADMARRQLFRDGRVPEFSSDPTEAQRLQLAALVALRANELAEAAKQAAAAEAARPRAPGFHNDTAFDDLRDADDLLAGNFEVLTTTGKYFWIPTERVLSAEFHPPKRPRDLIWRRASMSVAEGPDGDVYIPAIYAGGRAADRPAAPGPGNRLDRTGRRAGARRRPARVPGGRGRHRHHGSAAAVRRMSGRVAARSAQAEDGPRPAAAAGPADRRRAGSAIAIRRCRRPRRCSSCANRCARNWRRC